MQVVSLKNNARVVLRSVDPTDAPAIFEFLQRASGETDYSDFAADEFEFSESFAQQYIASTQGRPNHLFLLALLGNELIGMLTFSGGYWSRNRHTGELSMTVLQSAWGMGLGTAMLHHLFDWAQQGGIVTKINLRVRSDNRRAIGLYQKAGFLHEGTTRGDMRVAGEYFDHWRMGIWVDQALPLADDSR